ncbi:MAG: recombination mediator RecR [Legionellaceae bacterium]|nr:recombination mediator RecR [Legionellaceae bacterium]
MDALAYLVDALRCLPGIGPKSAQRMVFHLLQHQRSRGLHLAACLEEAMTKIKHCQICNNYTNESICKTCSDEKRDKTKICIVEGPTDVIAIEQSNAFKGRYYVLMGRISPLDGIGPEDIGLDILLKHIGNTNIQEVILALTPTIEGQTTVHFIKEMLKGHSVQISQLAHGIPSGGELTFLDSNTISSALKNRETLRELV